MISQLVEFSVKRKVTILMVALAVLAFGAVGFSRLPINLLPSLSYPSLTVQTELANAAPAEIEQLITRPVEEVVGVVKGLKYMHSVSRSGISEVTLEFGWDAQMSDLSMDIREKLDRLQLPLDADVPILLRYDPALDPILKISLSSELNASALGLSQLRLLGDKEVKQALERLEGVAAAKIQGGEEEEIHINIHQGKVAAMGISPQQLKQLLADSNINRPGGSLKNEQIQLLVRTLNEFDDLDEIRRVIITPPDRAAVTLGEIADVQWASKEKEEISRFNGREGVMVSIFKEGDANTVAVADRVKQQLIELQAKLPEGIILEVQFDQSRFIQGSIEQVKQALLIGGGLAILVLWLFLRDFRLTAIITTAIPLSVVATFIFMYRSDVSINIMSLGGLTLGVGMLVDSAIVVLESIYRRREQGLSVNNAAIQGTTDVGGAVTASVLTTIAVFIPIVFVEGIAGQLFRDQALTVTFSMLASLIASFTLIPMLASLGNNPTSRSQVQQSATDLSVQENAEQEYVEQKNTEQENTEQENTDQIAQPLGWLSRAYRRGLTRALNARWLTLSVGIGLSLVALYQLPKLPTALIPTLSEGEFYFDVSLPEGTALPSTDRLVAQMESIAAKHHGVAKVYSSIGSRNVSGGLALKNKDENLGQLNIVITDRADPQLEQQVIADLRDAFSTIPQANIQFGRPSFFSLKTPLEMLFFGENIEAMRAYSVQLLPLVAQIDGVVDAQASLQNGNPELKIEFDRSRLARFGLTIEQVADTLHQRISGAIVSRFQQPDRQIDIRLRNRVADRDSVNDMLNLVVGQTQGRPVSLGAVAKITPVQGPASIDRIQQSRVAVIAADLKNRSLSDVTAQITELVAQFPPPHGISFEFGGQNEEMSRSFDSLMFALALAVFLVYLVMAASFEHLGHPFIILFTIPMALVGVVLGLLLSGYAISVISMIGTVFLVGIVVNNAIVLVDAINQARRRGEEKFAAIVSASNARLRPILMTTCTTVLGLLPMAIGLGEGAELRAPLAVVVSFGLVTSTGLTLFIIPAAYLLLPSQVTTDEELAQLDSQVLQAEAQQHHALQNRSQQNQTQQHQTVQDEQDLADSSTIDGPIKGHV